MLRVLKYFNIYVQAAIFSFAVAFLDWESIRQVPFRDISNYISRIDNITNYGTSYISWENTISGWLTFEILWFKILEYASYLNMEPLTFLKYVTLVSAFLTYLYTRKNFGLLVSVAILLNPITIDLLSAQVRSGLAFSIFLTAISVGDGKIKTPAKILLLVLTPFIHSAMTIILAIYASSKFLESTKRIPEKYKQISFFSVILLSSVVMAIYVSSALEAIGDRRQLEGIAIKSQAYMVYWYLWAMAFAIPFLWKKTDWKVYFSTGTLLVGIVMNASGIAGFRFVALSIPVILSTVPSIRKGFIPYVIVISIIYDATLFYFWIQPDF
ncbi:hypothetical protein [Sphingopyxis terrae]|uniref:EpsG family protein n=1 Tax=Sphingopyxis terrae subsp. ummariensis TaxID=429001 RepID=A0A1Y6FPC9_9SPHN|nr:hypothetical protein [Sphingopyxis terrae]SMQ76589.1 hypothetical protein SAMN06295984_2028 [Sphingopyxis terrae subsp. ummariensis]